MTSKFINGDGLSKVLNMLSNDINIEFNKMSSYVSSIKENSYNAIKVTYSELVSLRDYSHLIPGQYYQIIDYVTTSSDENTMCANNYFDVVVLALEENSLSEEAYAVHSVRDDYFAASNLNAWKLWYCLDNDTDRFAWAGSTKTVFSVHFYHANGPRQFTRNESLITENSDVTYYGYTWSGGATSDLLTKDTILWYDEEIPEITDDYVDRTFYIMDENYNFNPIELSVQFMLEEVKNGKGVIYRMIDEFGNDCPYDFKNILFTRYELEAPDEYFTDDIGSKWLEQYATNVRDMFDIKAPSFVWAGLQLSDYYWEGEYGEVFSQVTMERKRFYTFSDITDFENKEETSDASLTSNTHNNKIGYSKDDIKMFLPNNVFFGKNCYDNSFGNNCINNSIGNWSYNNTFGKNCYNNTFGENCFNNKLYNECSSIIFNNFCYKNVFGLNSYSNSLGEGCYSNVFGQESYGNSFGVSCYSNIFGNAFVYNSFFRDCCHNSFGNNCWTNILSNDCNFNNFGNDCIENRFGMGYYYKYNTFGEGVQCLHLTNDEQGYYDNVVQNYHIANGTQGTSEEPLVINAERGRNYETTIARNSNGEIIEFCEADLNNNSVFYTTDNQFQRIDPNKVYVIINPISALRVDEYGIYGTTKIHEYKIHFVTSNDVEKLELPTETIWANGEIPSLEPNTYYELSVVNTPIGNNSYFKAILTSFK